MFNALKKAQAKADGQKQPAKGPKASSLASTVSSNATSQVTVPSPHEVEDAEEKELQRVRNLRMQKQWELDRLSKMVDALRQDAAHTRDHCTCGAYRRSVGLSIPGIKRPESSPVLAMVPNGAMSSLVEEYYVRKELGEFPELSERSTDPFAKVNSILLSTESVVVQSLVNQQRYESQLASHEPRFHGREQDTEEEVPVHGVSYQPHAYGFQREHESPTSLSSPLTSPPGSSYMVMSPTCSTRTAWTDRHLEGDEGRVGQAHRLMASQVASQRTPIAS